MYFTISQNNVYGQSIVNAKVADYLIIEANNLSEAEDLLLDITEDNDSYCECCGSRWSGGFHNKDGDEEPSIYETTISEWIEYGTSSVIIHYKNGVVETINYRGE